MPKLAVIIASTRPKRAGEPVAKWFVERAKAHGGFDVELVDLKEVNLPFLDEPEHPRLQKYEKAHTKSWSAKIAATDAFVFVTPEYNYSAPPALMNALNFLVKEWAYKAVGFVSYGGVSGGLRSVQVTKASVTALSMMPLAQGVAIPLIASQLAPDGTYPGDEKQEKAAKAMLDELAKWTTALMTMRA